MSRVRYFKIFAGTILFSILASGFPLYAVFFDSQSDDKTTAAVSDEAPFTFGTFREIAKRESPAVVNIATTKIFKRNIPPNMQPWRSPFDDLFGDDFFHRFFNEPRNQKVQSLGSGVVIEESGYILTNNHVVEEVDEIQVNTLDGKTYEAEIVGTDSMTDIALLKIEAEQTLATIPFGDSDKLEAGDWVMAIGNPFGLGHTVTVGVVSAKGRSTIMPQNELPYQDFIQTDASINPGNSGGPLLNVQGELVGINSVIYSRTGQSAGIGFSIPINLILPLVTQLKETGTVTRGWLGVTIQSLSEELANSLNLPSTKGALVAEIIEDGPADRAGIKVQDVIIRFDGTEIRNSSHLSQMVAASPVGKKFQIDLIRGNKEKNIQVKLGERPENPSQIKTQSGVFIDLGMTVQDLTPEIARELGIEKIEGILISNVESGSPSDRAGLRRGDIILEFNQEKISSVKQYQDAVKKLAPGESAVLYIRRGDSKIFVAVKISKS
ncbi:DegQ family serine endoprotease [bacterium]|nr:DegQ family serine endoprotease [candidate division CSSED10-310 bacterium]